VDCRPITLLKAEYKIFVTVLASRIMPRTQYILHPGHKCGVANITFIEGPTGVRDFITLEFQQAFDKTLHENFLHILHTLSIRFRFSYG